MVYKGYKYRIYPNSAQRQLLDATLSACRIVYNLALELKIHAYKQHGIKLSAFDLCKDLPGLKKDHPWIAAVDSQALQASVKKVDVAFKQFFQGAGYPKFKSRRSTQSFQCPNNTRKVDFGTKRLTIPKIASIPIRLSRRFEGKIKSITVSKTPSGKYYASILVAQDIQLPALQEPIPGRTIGIDMGLSHFAILDDGTKIDNPRHLQAAMLRLKVLQRRASRKKKGSSNRKKANKRLAIQHERVANSRRDFLHKLSSLFTNRSDNCDNQATTICVETLRVSNMLRNHRLAQAIQSAGWAEFLRQLEYKCAWAGIRLLRIGAFEASTKTCNNCGTKNDVLSLKDREWTCATCNVTHDRDINAAKNIKSMGLQYYSGRGTPEGPVESPALAGTAKQEAVACLPIKGK